MKKDCGESFGGNYSSPSPFKDLQSMTNDSAREIHITSGHPKLFIESLIVNLVFHMNYRAEENAEPLAHLFPDLIDHKTIEGSLFIYIIIYINFIQKLNIYTIG